MQFSEAPLCATNVTYTFRLHPLSGTGDSLPLERLWSPIVAKTYVIFSYFNLTFEPHLVQTMAQKTASRNSSQ